MSKKSKKSKGFLRSAMEKLFWTAVLAGLAVFVLWAFFNTEAFAPVRAAIVALGQTLMVIGALGGLVMGISQSRKGLGTCLIIVAIGGVLVAAGSYKPPVFYQNPPHITPSYTNERGPESGTS